jgi:hypothetical protein
MTILIKTYYDLTYNDFTYNINKRDITYMFLFTVISNAIISNIDYT